MLIFNKSNLLPIVLALNLATNVVVADFSNVLAQIGEVMNSSGDQQQQQTMQHETHQKVLLSDDTEKEESKENFEALLGNDLGNRNGINSIADGLFGKIPNPFCLIPGTCPKASTTAFTPKPTSTTTTATGRSPITPTSSSAPIPTSLPPIPKPTTTTTITAIATTTTSSQGPTPTEASYKPDLGSIAKLFFDLFKKLVEAILKAIKGEK